MDHAINLAERGEYIVKIAKRKPEKTRTTKWDIEIGKKTAFKREKSRLRKFKWYEFDCPEEVLEPTPKPFVVTPVEPDWLEYFKQLLKWQRNLSIINNQTSFTTWCPSSILTMLDCDTDSDYDDYYP